MTPHTLHKHTLKRLDRLILLVENHQAFKLHDHPPVVVAHKALARLNRIRERLQEATTHKQCAGVLVSLESMKSYFIGKLKAQALDCYHNTTNSLIGLNHDLLMVPTQEGKK